MLQITEIKFDSLFQFVGIIFNPSNNWALNAVVMVNRFRDLVSLSYILGLDYYCIRLTKMFFVRVQHLVITL
jgi:hypothetical protein